MGKHNEILLLGMDWNGKKGSHPSYCVFPADKNHPWKAPLSLLWGSFTV
jgi:hypothetical protein